MAEDFIKVTNPMKYKPHYDSIIKAEFTEATIKIILNNDVSPHCKIGFIYNGIRHYEEVFYVRKNAKIQLFVDCDDGYVVKYIYLNSEKYLPGILGQDITIEFDTLIYVEEEIRSYYANFEAALHTTLTYHFINGSGEEITNTLSGGESNSYRLPYGTEIDVGYTIETGYNGELRKSDVKTLDTHFILDNEDLWLATFATKKIYTVHMYYPDEAKLEVSYRDDQGVEYHYETGELADQTKITEYFDAVHGSQLLINVTTKIGTIVSHIYINETLDIPNPSTYNLTSNISIKAIVNIKQNSVKILHSDKCNNVVIYHGIRYDDRAGTFMVRYGDYIYFDITPIDSFKHYVKAVKINGNEYPGLESFQVLENINVDSVAGDNIFPKVKINIDSVLHGTIYVFYIDQEYTAEDSPIDALQNYSIQIWMDPWEGYKNKNLYVNGISIPHDRVVAYKLTENITISGETQLIV